MISRIVEIPLAMIAAAGYFNNRRNAEGMAMDQTRAIAALGALAQETRLALFRLLVTCGPAGLPAGAIAERLGVPPSSLSFHLQQLAHAGLITQRRFSRQLIYSAEYGAMNALLAYLTENCCGRGAVCPPACDPTAGCGTAPKTTAA
jgi:ArsR family transcriptional regulator, arsenate/arsenite/antimonite-responsive transcriptional repressor